MRLGNGLRMSYLSRGARSDPTMLLLHAWAESSGSFSRVLPLLPSHLHLLVPDLRGHGGTDKPLHGYDLPTLAADCAAFLDRLHVETAVVVGSSSGGYVGQQLAVDHPERVTGLVLLGSPYSLEHTSPGFASTVLALTDPVDPDVVQRLTAGMTRRADVPAAYLEERVQDGLALPAEVWRATIQGLVESSAPARTGAVDTPTLVVWGDEDDVLGEDQLSGLRQAIQRCQVIRYAETGHAVLWEEPARVAADVTRFVAELTGPGVTPRGRSGLAR